MSITVLVADPRPRRRAGRCARLNAEADIEVVAACADGPATRAAARRLRPDAALTVLTPPATSTGGPGFLGGIGLIRALAAQCRTPVVVLADTDAQPVALRALGAGARGYLLPGEENNGELARAVRAAAAGDAWISSRITPALIDRCLGRGEPPGAQLLTPRERQVLPLVGAGLSTREIADRLVLAPTTAKGHINSILGKLGVTSRTRLVSLAYESGLLRPGRTPAATEYAHPLPL
jgi:DNA-binding NarL/FixJ family response regulator